MSHVAMSSFTSCNTSTKHTYCACVCAHIDRYMIYQKKSDDMVLQAISGELTSMRSCKSLHGILVMAALLIVSLLNFMLSWCPILKIGGYGTPDLLRLAPYCR